MAIALDATGSGESQTNNTTATMAITVGTISNGILVVFVSWIDAQAGTASVSSVSSNVDGALTAVASSTATVLATDGADWGLAAYYLLSPTAGAHTITLTMSENTNNKFIGGSSYSGVNQSAPLGTAITTTGTTGNPVSLANIESVADDFVLGGILTYADAGNDPTASVGTRRWVQNETAVEGSAAAHLDVTATGTATTVTWGRQSAIAYLLNGFALKQAAAGAASGSLLLLNPNLHGNLYGLRTHL